MCVVAEVHPPEGPISERRSPHREVETLPKPALQHQLDERWVEDSLAGQTLTRGESLARETIG